MKELGRLLNKKTIMIMIAAAFICVAAVVARDFSDCGIDNYNVKVREYHWRQDIQMMKENSIWTACLQMKEGYIKDLQKNMISERNI